MLFKPSPSLKKLLILLSLIFIVCWNERNIFRFSEQLGVSYWDGLANFQRLFCYFFFGLFSYLKLSKKSARWQMFFLSVSLTYFFFCSRFIRPYLFQDDYYHYLTIIRGDFWAGLFIPFVDHVSPLWRLIQSLNIYIFGSYYAIATLPFVGALAIGASCTALYSTLERYKVENAFLMTLLLACYPGYRSILFWVSTNSIAVSTVFGILALGVAYRRTDRDEKKTYDLLVLFLLLNAAFFSWTTGIVYPIFLAFMSLFNIATEKYFGRTCSKRSHIGILTIAVLSGCVFAASRMLAYKFYDADYVSSLIWIKNGLEHGYERNLLRPLLWPLFAVFDGLILNGGYDISRDNNDFMGLVVGGSLFFIVVFSAGFYFRNKHLLFAYAFAFLSFAVVFVKRGMGSVSHRTPQGYLDFALSNDWYRISALAGTLYFLALSAHSIKGTKAKKHIKWALVVTLLIFIRNSTHYSSRNEYLADLNLENSRLWRESQCLTKLPWNSEDYYYASANMFAPMRGANPGNYWLGYEPTWFDMKASGSPKNLEFSQDRSKKLAQDIESTCDKGYLGKIAQKFAWSENSFDPQYAAEPPSQLQTKQIEKTVSITAPSSQDICPWARYQLLSVELASTKQDANSHLTLNAETSITAVFKTKAAPVKLIFDLRALPIADRCKSELQFEIDSEAYAVSKMSVIRFLN